MHTSRDPQPSRSPAAALALGVLLLGSASLVAALLGLAPRGGHGPGVAYAADDEAPTAEAPAEAASEEGEPEAGATPSEEPAPCDFPAPAPRDGCCPPAPCCPPARCCPPVACAPTARLQKNSCCWPRDACGWALDPCGQKLGRTEVVIEGAFTRLDDMTGTLGEPRTGSLSWNGNGYDGEPGGRLTIRRALSPRDKLELRAVRYGEFEASSRQSGTFGFSPPAGGSAFVPNAVLDNESELGSLEANWWREFRCCGRLRWSHLVGLRALQLEETAGAAFPIAGAPTASVLSEVETSLLAAQLGGAVSWYATRRLEASLGAKLLLGAMRSDVDVSDDSVFAGGQHASSDEQTQFALGAEVELSLLLRLTRHIALTAGYAALFVNDVTRANDGMNFSQAATGAVQAQQSGSELFVQTIFAGFQFNF